MRRVHLWASAAFLIGYASLPSVIASETASEPLCGDAMTTLAMQECLTEQHQMLDQELNDVYRDLMGELPRARREKLKAAQVAWLAFRDRAAEFQASASEGGSLSNLEYSVALVELTRDRVGQLRGHLEMVRNE